MKRIYKRDCENRMMDSRSIRDWSALGLVNSFQIGSGARLKFCKSLKNVDNNGRDDSWKCSWY